GQQHLQGRHPRHRGGSGGLCLEQEVELAGGRRPNPPPSRCEDGFMALGDKAGLESVKKAGEVVDDIQADLDRRWGALVAMLQRKCLRIRVAFSWKGLIVTVEVENKELK
ncbi:MAG: hypothetical protein ABH877_03375, partial [bacterium]